MAAPQLPPEIWMQVFRHSCSLDIHTRIKHVCRQWERLVRCSPRSLPLVPVHCSVDVLEGEPSVYPCGLEQPPPSPILLFAFSAYNTTKGLNETRMRACESGDDERTSVLLIETTLQAVKGDEADASSRCHVECASRCGSKSVVVDERTAAKLIASMSVVSLRIEVTKRSPRRSSPGGTSASIHDDILHDVITWCTAMAGKMQIRCVHLSSHNALSEWRLGQRSLSTLRRVAPASLTVENMPSISIFSRSNRLPSLVSLFVRMLPLHPKPTSTVHYIEVDVSFLLSLLSSHSLAPLHYYLLSDVATAVATLTADDLASFVLAWRSHSMAVHIRSLSFNSLVTLSDLQNTLTSRGMANVVHEVPYCRYRTVHPVVEGTALELSCYGNGMSTQWSLRTGTVS